MFAKLSPSWPLVLLVTHNVYPTFHIIIWKVIPSLQPYLPYTEGKADFRLVANILQSMLATTHNSKVYQAPELSYPHTKWKTSAT